MMKLGNISPLTLFFFFQLVSSLPGLLCFHMHLKNSLLISTKTWYKLLTSIVSSLHSQTLSHFHTIHFYICYNFPLSIWLFLRDLNNKKRTFIFTQVVTIFCVLPCWSRFSPGIIFLLPDGLTTFNIYFIAGQQMADSFSFSILEKVYMSPSYFKYIFCWVMCSSLIVFFSFNTKYVALLFISLF